jgi:4-hydroxy-tetrahydrodipicolinate reductase
MKIALIGYGKMGKEIEQIIVAEGKHEVVLKIGEENLNEFTVENLKNADVAIEFTEPNAAFNNVKTCFEANVPVVVGTTSWNTEEAVAMAQKEGKSLFLSPNYSIGVNLFFELNKKLNALMQPYSEYQMDMTEIHHTQKKDAPSGTAIKLAQDLISLSNNSFESWALDTASNSSEIAIKAMREEHVPGTHIVNYQSDIDAIEIKHTAFSRKGFAIGAVRAAEFLYGKNGVFGMKDLLGIG